MQIVQIRFIKNYEGEQGSFNEYLCCALSVHKADVMMHYKC